MFGHSFLQTTTPSNTKIYSCKGNHLFVPFEDKKSTQWIQKIN